jgi:hypothetical protein
MEHYMQIHLMEASDMVRVTSYLSEIQNTDRNKSVNFAAKALRALASHDGLEQSLAYASVCDIITDGTFDRRCSMWIHQSCPAPTTVHVGYIIDWSDKIDCTAT